jgi:dTDP-4-amino-4,6-dideoxygalactose transaminase
MKVPFRDLRVKDEKRRNELLKAVEDVLVSGQIMSGPEVEILEEKIASICSRNHAVGVGSGTMAIYLVLRALDIGQGDEVITTPLSWIATSNAILLAGAKPVFVDVDYDFNLDPNLVEEAITERTKCILPVHLMGKLCRMNQFKDIAEKHNLYLVEDAAQALGAHLDSGYAGSFGDAGCFSMNPMKILCAAGEAGMIVTDDISLHEQLKSLRYLGTYNKGDCLYPSFNGKIDTIHAAMLCAQLDWLEEKIRRSREIASFYTQCLREIVKCPEETGPDHIFLSYVILTPERDSLVDFLFSKGIETKIQYPVLIPDNTAYRGKYKFNTPVAQKMADEMISLPNQDYITLKDAEYVVDCIKLFFDR